MSNLQINDSFEPYFAKRKEATEGASAQTPTQTEMRKKMQELLQKRGSAKPTHKPTFQK
ncbi:MAG: hypothetical protein Q8Q62_20390 [Mesorhizobium sp.]|nr:hypothetical protein [Mesorhizobium sp.]